MAASPAIGVEACCAGSDTSGAEVRPPAELVQARQLEEIGRLAAGLAHELNTPAQYVTDGVVFTRDSLRDLLRLLGAHRALVEEARRGPVSAARLAQLDELDEELDLGFLLDNVPRALQRSIEGLDRITTLVRAMSAFAAPGPDELSPADLNAALLATIAVASGEFERYAYAETDLGPLPRVRCRLATLNPVFLGLVSNGAHAIEEVVGASGRKGFLRVTTRAEGDHVRLSFSDTGAGIPAEIAPRIFEPGFTTKGPPRGAGHGLAIARRVIVEQHRGALTFETNPGRGTTFHVLLPVAP